MKKIGMLKRIFGTAIVLVMLGISIIGVIPVSAAPADCYWVGDGGNWSDAANHWAIASGGAPGAGNLPDSTSNVHFDANSFTVGSQIVTVDIVGQSKDMDWTGVTNLPRLQMSGSLNIYGDIILKDMTTNGGGTLYLLGSNDVDITTNNVEIKYHINDNKSGGTVTLQDNLNIYPTLSFYFNTGQGTFDTNGKTVTCNSFNSTGTSTRTLTLSSSTINCNVWNTSTTTNLTFNANTSTIKVLSGNFSGGDSTYNNVELNGTAHTISGSNTFNTLTIANSATITVTAATTQTFADIDCGTNVTLQSSAGGNSYNLICTGTSVTGVQEGLTMTDAVVTAPNAPANKRYWVQDGGNWSDDDNHWSAMSGYLPAGATVWLPTSSDDVYFDANSFSLGGQTVTIDVSAYCKDFDCSAVTNNPTIASGTGGPNIYGNVLFSPNMVYTSTGGYGPYLRGSSNRNIDINGADMTGSGFRVYTDMTGTLEFLSPLVCNFLYIQGGEWNLNGHNVTQSGNSAGIRFQSAVSKTLNLEGSIVTCDKWDISGSTNNTINGGTIVTGGNFIGGDLSYNIVKLTGDATIEGDNSFAQLWLSGGTQTITFTDGTTQTVTSLTRDAGTDIKTLQGSGVGGWTIDNVSGAEIDIDNVDVSYGTVTTDDINAAKLSINSGNNSGWNFLFTPVTNLATGISMTGFNTTATLNGTISDLGGDYPVTLILEWGYTTAYGNTALNTTTSTVPTSVSAVITQFDPEQTVHFRLRAVNLLGTTSGADQTIPPIATAWYSLIHTLLPVAVAAVILIGVLIVMGNPLAAFLSAMTGLVGYYVILALVSPNWA